MWPETWESKQRPSTHCMALDALTAQLPAQICDLITVNSSATYQDN